MDYLLCIPARETNTRENCEKIHNVLARMSDTYKLRIVPESVKNKQFPCPPYYKKYRIYKPVKERDTNGEAYLEKEEEEMILSSCKTEEEQELMKSCIYAYQYSASIVLKSFREKEKKNKMQVRPLSERMQAAKGAGAPARGGRPGAEKQELERGTQERSMQDRGTRARDIQSRSVQERPSGGDRTYRNRAIDRPAEGGTERPAGRERDRETRVPNAERMADRRGGNRVMPENEKNEARPAAGRRERFERRPSRRGERPETERTEIVKAEIVKTEVAKTEAERTEIVRTEVLVETRSNDAPAQGVLPFRAGAETGSLPPFRDTAPTVTAQPMQRKSEGYAPMERKTSSQPQSPDTQA